MTQMILRTIDSTLTISYDLLSIPSPINEFETSGLASLAFVKLFPLGQADPTKKGRMRTVREVEASSHLLKYAEPDPSHPDGELYNPFGEHPRFSFYMVSTF